MTILNELNDKQREAATQIEGPVLVIAGAGSGKTKTITTRIANMIASGIDSQSILAVTFTNKAAKEMKERIHKTLTQGKNPVNSMPFVGTFHSFCVRFLREELKSNFVIYDSDDQLSLIKGAMKELEIDDKQFKPSSVQAAISSAKNEMLSAEKFSQKAEGYFQETIAKVFKKYEDELEKANSLDFDDLLSKTVTLLETKPEILEKYQERYKYITVDEYQDTNFAQYKIINMLARKYRNLCVVGDDQQSIYSFRGADFRNILNFEKDYPEAKIVLLEENYRSTKTILNAANKVISKNTVKRDKNLWTQNADGCLINAVLSSNERQEADFAATEIKRLAREERIKLSQCCIMYRTNAQSRAAEEALIKNQLPYQLIGGLRFYERKEIKDILAYVRIVFNPKDQISIQRVLNVPTRGMGKYEKIYGQIVARLLSGKTEPIESTNDTAPLETEQHINNSLFPHFEMDNHKIKNNDLQLKESLGVRGKKLELLKKFADLINEIKSATTAESGSLTHLIKNIVSKTNYEQHLVADYQDAENRIENIKELFSVTSTYDHLPLEEGLKSFLENTALVSDTDNIDEYSDKVQVMTVHASKGLEFDAVFVLAMEEGVFPHSRSSLNPAELEEERRLCYVAITRARKHLYLMFAMRRRLFGAVLANSPSRFLFDIPQELVSYRQLNDISDGLLEIEY